MTLSAPAQANPFVTARDHRTSSLTSWMVVIVEVGSAFFRHANVPPECRTL